MKNSEKIRDYLNNKVSSQFKKTTHYNSKEIKELRNRFNLSQNEFSMLINVETKTVQSWEQGINNPNGAALRLLNILDNTPELITKIYTMEKENEINSELFIDSILKRCEQSLIRNFPKEVWNKTRSTYHKRVGYWNRRKKKVTNNENIEIFCGIESNPNNNKEIKNIHINSVLCIVQAFLEEKKFRSEIYLKSIRKYIENFTDCVFVRKNQIIFYLEIDDKFDVEWIEKANSNLSDLLEYIFNYDKYNFEI